MLNHAHLFVTVGYYLLPTARYNKPCCTSTAGPLPVQPKWKDGVTVELATKITCLQFFSIAARPLVGQIKFIHSPQNGTQLKLHLISRCAR